MESEKEQPVRKEKKGTWSQDESNFFLGSGSQSPDDTVQG